MFVFVYLLMVDIYVQNSINTFFCVLNIEHFKISIFFFNLFFCQIAFSTVTYSAAMKTNFFRNFDFENLSSDNLMQVIAQAMLVVILFVKDSKC